MVTLRTRPGRVHSGQHALRILVLARSFFSRFSHLIVLVFLFLFCPYHLVCSESSETYLSCPDFSYFKPQTGPLAAVNCDFHHLYELRVADLVNSFGAPGGRPVVLNLGGTLILKHNGKQETVAINSNEFHQIKAFGHAALAVALGLENNSFAHSGSKINEYLHSLNTNLKRASQMVDSLNLNLEEKQKLKQLVLLTKRFLQVLFNKKNCSLEAKIFFKEIKPLIFEINLMAAKRELAALDAAMDAWMTELSPLEQKKIYVVVAASHQAKVDELSVQYFNKRFGSNRMGPPLQEKSLVVIEDKFDEASALKLLARHDLDIRLSKNIFKQAHRLQRDLLADAAKILLNEKKSN